MDKRKILESGTVLRFPGMECTITDLVGKGSNSLVYKGTYPDEMNKDQLHYVLIKELFPYHPKNEIYRDTDGNIAVTDEGKHLYDVHRQSFEYGNKIHLTMLRKHPDKSSGNINSFFLNNTAYSVLSFSGGRSLDDELIFNNGNYDLKKLSVRFLKLLEALDAFHSSGYLHLDISPDNILLIGNGDSEQIILIDYNSVHPISDLSGENPGYFSTKPGYSAPEVRHGSTVSAESDIFSVGAVFFRCLKGEMLTLSQIIAKAPPDVSASPYLANQPSSVADLVRKILFKCLAVTAKRRYHSVEEIKKDFSELIDRIDGVGITHWSLWETGLSNIINIINNNKSYEYIKNTDALYPSYLVTDNGEKLSAVQAIFEKTKETSFYLTGEGGVGKTTLLLRSVYQSERHYSSLQPAIVYVSLFGWDGSENYIKDRILENMHFKTDISSYAVARHRLIEVFNKTLKTQAGENPSVIIMLDGLNEADGDTEALTKEISSIAACKGVRFVVTSRTIGDNKLFPTYNMLPLTKNDVERALGDKGLITQDSQEIKELLRIPMMLSAYIRIAENSGKQLNITTKEQLLAQYIRSLCDKQTYSSEDNAQKKWIVEAAVYFVLPAISDYMLRSKCSCSDTELFDIVKKCYKVITSRILFSAFPDWTGHSSDILNGAKNADSWYGDTVQKLLWSKMGLLTKDNSGKYKICHQLVAEFSAYQYTLIQKRISSKRIAKAALTAFSTLICAGAVLTGICMITPETRNSIINQFSAIDEEKAEEVINYSVAAYTSCANICSMAYDALENADNPKDFRHKMSVLETHGFNQAVLNYSKALNTLLTRKKVIMPWSYKELDREYLTILLDYPEKFKKRYSEYLSYAEYAMEKGEKEYTDALKKLLDADAKYVEALFQYSVLPHLNEMDKDSIEYRTAIKTISDNKKQSEMRNSIEISHTYEVTSLLSTVKTLENDVIRMCSKYKILLGEN